MQRLLFGILALALVGPVLEAQDDKNKPKPATPAEEYKALVADFRQLREETGKVFKAAKDDAEKKRIFEEYEKKKQAIAARFLSLGQTHGKDLAGVDALQMVLNLGSDADQDKAVSLLRALADKAPDKTVQAHAAYQVAAHLKQQYDESELKPEAAQKQGKEIENLLDRAVKHLAGAADPKSKQILANAEKQLFEVRNLAIGKSAPDIEGADADGKKFKLSEYRGKVVVLDFWASWCGPCMAMVPHERELVKRLEGKPFALLGVNLDNTAAELKKTEAAHKMTWRSFFDGSDGPIAAKWNVQSIPAIYVLDHKGVIRYKGLRDKDMDKAVETLLQEVPAADKK